MASQRLQSSSSSEFGLSEGRFPRHAASQPTVPVSVLKDKKALEGLLQILRELVAGKPFLRALIADWQIAEADDRLVIRSPSLPTKLSTRQRAGLLRLNNLLQRHPVRGQVVHITKPRSHSYYAVAAETGSEPLTVWIDPTYERLREMVARLGGAKRAIFIQHSGDSPRALISELLRKGAEVDLYLADPATTAKVSNSIQRRKVTNIIREVPGYFGMISTGKLRIWTVPVPSSLRITQIDLGSSTEPEDQLFVTGFYAYYITHNATGKKMIEMQGHDLPQVVFSSRGGTPGFSLIKAMVDWWLECVRLERCLVAEWPPKNPAQHRFETAQ